MTDYLNSAKSSINTATEAISNNIPDPNALASSISNGANSIRDTTQNVASDFSSQGVNDASQEFLNSNSMIAKFAFVILVLIVFMFFLNIGIGLVTYFMAPTKSPYIIHGMLPGRDYNIYPQDPAGGTAIVYRSNNKMGGIEFTWTFWLKIDTIPTNSNYMNVFLKGTDTYDTSGISNVNNAPGVYLYKNTQTTASGEQLALLCIFDSASPDETSQLTPKKIEIENLPIRKWFHVAIRLQNKTMDCYVNGIITKRESFGDYIPKQNYDPIIFAGNGGFAGSISNLRYYDYALSVFELNSVVYYGPNLSSANGAASSYFDYLGKSWYNG